MKKDLTYLILLVALSAMGFTSIKACREEIQGVEFSVSDGYLDCFGGNDCVDETVDGRTVPPTITANYYRLDSKANFRYTLVRKVDGRVYQRLLKQAEENGLWSKSSVINYCVPPCQVDNGAPSGPVPAGPRDDEKLSQAFFKDPVIAAMCRQIKWFYCAHAYQKYPKGVRVGEILIDS